jgi:hypothetical protein
VQEQSQLNLVVTEYQRAWEARRQGREGRARVCARRAAGWALPPHGSQPSVNVLRRLEALAGDPAAPVELRQAAERLITHLTPDHQLPHPQDPLDDARRIIEAYLPGSLPAEPQHVH